ncbi:unnamed protein product [Cuscuta campestris]|uniref:Uncharacterized protein n=1 Tax=Cuscuta campestris TaxID=132261 RepID=A0A484MWX8_9ASTE|nr:unnamed protein product [Cuscuta campestris]
MMMTLLHVDELSYEDGDDAESSKTVKCVVYGKECWTATLLPYVITSDWRDPIKSSSRTLSFKLWVLPTIFTASFSQGSNTFGVKLAFILIQYEQW